MPGGVKNYFFLNKILSGLDIHDHEKITKIFNFFVGGKDIKTLDIFTREIFYNQN